jgi:hypothetical protein
MLGAAVRTYGRLARTLPHGSEAVESALAAELDAARQLQEQLARHLEPRAVPDDDYSQWPVRGEILSHVDRLRAGLKADTIVPDQRRPRRPLPPRRPHPLGELRVRGKRMATGPGASGPVPSRKPASDRGPRNRSDGGRHDAGRGYAATARTSDHSDR